MAARRDRSPVMHREILERRRWVSEPTFLHALNYCMLLPGPEAQQLATYLGFLGAVLSAWVTFVPSFLWVLAGAPYVERLRNRVTLSGGLSTITAAVVGAVLNLGIWFALFTLFGEVSTTRILGALVYLPDPTTIDWAGMAIAAGAAIALFRYQRPIIQVVAGAALAGLVLALI